MGIGLGILLLAVGAVLAFAVHVTVAGVSLVTIGWILMVVGVVGLVLDVALFAPRRRRVTTAEPGYPGRTVTTRDDVV
jgi:hypothetical protein